MAELLSLQLMKLLKRVSKQFNRKLTEIVFILSNHKSAGSLGALAGFAIAIVFTWKFLKGPVQSRRGQRKETGSGSTSNVSSESNEVSSCTENYQIVQSEKEVRPIDGFHPLEELSLGQRVSMKLNGSRKMTCQLLGIVLEESSPEELQDHATVRTSVVEVLLEISKFCDIYLMERILDDESGDRVILALEKAGLFQTGALMKDKVLFCSTENGRSSFVRQLEPDWHVDTNSDILSQLARFIRYQLHISPTKSSLNSGSITFCSTTLESFFAEERDV